MVDRQHPSSVQQTGAQRAMEAIREAEASKACIYEISGNSVLPPGEGNCPDVEVLRQGFAHSMMVDEGFTMVAAHVDCNTKNKIAKGEYVKFSKLLSRDQVEPLDDECKMEMINKEGCPVWVPASEREATTINSFGKWKQAFRVYSDIYIKANASRVQELIQYNHVIYTASLSYHWDNVYKYDKLFRLHMEQNPTRSWAIILQQAWSLCLKDRISTGGKMGLEVTRNDTGTSGRKGKPCYRFNRGKCNFGMSCKFEHKCLACAKYRHGTHNCCRLHGSNGGDKDASDKNYKKEKRN